jgi:two-component system cell cycle response regulator
VSAEIEILVADDDPLARHLTERVLTRAGYKVITADTGLEALEHLMRADGPRLGLLDWSMPGLDGPEVCRRVRAGGDRSYSYLILLTSRESKEDLILGLEAGADDFLTKPCHADELKARLRVGGRILQLQDKLFHEARHDPLTQLPNRSWFLQKLTDCFNRAKAQFDYHFGVLFIDLDGFKAINDQYGHSAGDVLLQQVAERLTGCLRPDDSVTRATEFSGLLARLGGDEFTILLGELRNEGDAAIVAERIERTLSAPFMINGRNITISASVGVAAGNARYSCAEDVLCFADAAMYTVKARKDTRVQPRFPAHVPTHLKPRVHLQGH